MTHEYVKIAYRNIRHRTLRSLLTLLGIIIAVSTIFVLISISLGLQSAVQEQFRLIGTDKFFIIPKGQASSIGTQSANKLTIDDVNVIGRVNGVMRTTYFASGSAEVKFGDEIRYFPLYGLPAKGLDLYFESNMGSITEGKSFRTGDSGKLLIGWDYAHGSVFSREVKIGNKMTINGREFKVVGILPRVGNSQDDKNLIISYDDMKEMFSLNDTVDYIMVQTNVGEDIKDVAARAEKRLRSYRGLTEKTQDFTILTPEELLATFGNILSIITVFLLGIAAVSLVVGGIGVANTMFTSVIERTKEIGVMKAIGAQKHDIVWIFMVESGLLGLVGGIMGILLGIGISKSIEYIAINFVGTTLLKAAIPWYLIVGCLAFSLLVGALSGLWPAWRATDVKPVEALRYE